MIQIDNLSLSYHGDPLFTGATFSIQGGEKCGLVGRNGSGKSTIFRLITNKEVPDTGNIVIRRNYTIGILDQHIVFTQPTILEEACLGLRPEEKDCIYKAEKILFGLGFREEDMEKTPDSFSGGYQLRLHLAKVLISEPNCLLLDEPTNYLDIVSIRWFTRFLKQWRGEFIIISHDREFMDDVTTHTMGIHRQKVRKTKGSTIDFYTQLLEEETIHEKTRVNLEKKRAHAQSFVERFGAKASKAAQAQSRVKMLERIPTLEKLKEIYNLEFHFNEAFFPGKKMLDVKDLSFSYNKEQENPLIHNLSLEVEKGERVAIIGKNGRGKSTILRLLNGELTPDQGTVKASDNIATGYFGQTNIDRLHPKHSVTEEISSANRALSFTEVKGICGLMMFSGAKSDKKTQVLSGGEKSRVLLGKILAAPCNLLMLDEPTHHLDMESVEALIDAIEDFNGAVIIVTHSELILKRIALDKIIVCRQDGQEQFLGSYEEFLEKDGWHDASESEKPKKKNPNKQHQEMVAERSKNLKQENEIAKLEKAIASLEQEQNQTHDLLAKASAEGNVEEIKKLSKEIDTRQKQIDQHYTQLERLIS